MEDRMRSIETALRKAIEARGATTPEARQLIYEAAERALARLKIPGDGEGGNEREQMLRQSLAVATKRIEQTFTGSRLGTPLPHCDHKDEISMTQPSDMQTPPPERSGSSAKIWLALLLFLLIAASGTYFYLGQRQIGILVGVSQQDDFVTETPLTLTTAEGFQITPNAMDDYVTVAAIDTPPENALPPGVTLSSEFEQKFAGKKVIITVTARSPAIDGAKEIGIVYLTLGNGNSGWQAFPLTPEFSDISFDYAVPEVGSRQGEDFVGFLPPIGRSVDIKRVRVSVKSR